MNQAIDDEEGLEQHQHEKKQMVEEPVLWTYQECTEKVESTEVNNWSDGASAVFIWCNSFIALCVVETMEHNFVPVLAGGRSAKKERNML